MNLKNLLLEKKQGILEKWFDLILETYPPDTANHLRNQRNQFTNPVGHSILHGIEGLFEEIVNSLNFERITPYLDNIIRIRAIQDFTPSQALGFLFLLKKVIREELKQEIAEHQLFEELLSLESRIDEIIKVSFDVYMKCREKIYELSADETKRWTFRLLKGANIIDEAQEKIRM